MNNDDPLGVKLEQTVVKDNCEKKFKCQKMLLVTNDLSVVYFHFKTFSHFLLKKGRTYIFHTMRKH